MSSAIAAAPELLEWLPTLTGLLFAFAILFALIGLVAAARDLAGEAPEPQEIRPCRRRPAADCVQV